jgi:uncharacterized protein
MLPRPAHLERLGGLLRRHPVVGLVGARQVGKTTLARALAAEQKSGATFFDLEDPRALARLESPTQALEDLRGLVVLDEIHHRPDLFPILRVLADREGTPARFLVLGSASPELLRQGSETLAGRIAWHELPGLDLSEVGDARDPLWLRGGFPRSLLAESDEASLEWRIEFVRSYLERDLAGLGVRTPAATLRRFWTMLAHYHGQVWNSTELARAFGVSDKTVRHYLDLLASTFMVLRLESWHENIGKRQVKAPKIYLADSGILHALLGLSSQADLLAHPKVGASWEGFALQEIVRHIGARREECYFFGLHSGGELDLLVVRGRKRLGFEMKFTDSPRTTRSMHTALEVLGLAHLDVIHAGKQTFELGKGIRALALERISEDLEPLH